MTTRASNKLFNGLVWLSLAIFLLFMAKVIFSFLASIELGDIAPTQSILVRLAASVTTLVLLMSFVAFVTVKTRNTRTLQKIFVALCLMLCGWLLFLAFSEFLARDNLLFWARLPYYFMAWFPETLVLLFYYYLNKRLPRPGGLLLLFGLSTVFLVGSQTKLYLVDANRNESFEQIIISGSWYFIDSLHYLIAIFLILFIVNKSWAQLNRVQKKVLLLIFPGYAISFLPAIISIVIFQWLSVFLSYDMLGVILSLVIFVGVTAMAVFQERFLELRLALAVRFRITLLAGLSTSIYTISAYLTHGRTNLQWTISFIVFFAIAPFAIRSFYLNWGQQPNRDWMKKALRLILPTLFLVVLPSIVSATSQKDLTNAAAAAIFGIFVVFQAFRKIILEILGPEPTPKVLNELVRRIGQKSTLSEKIVTLILELTKQLGLKGAAYCSKADGKMELTYNVNMPPDLFSGNLINSMFEFIKESPIIKVDSLSDDLLSDKLSHYQAEILVPIRKNDTTIGLVILREKIGGITYTDDDLHMLTVLSSHLAADILNTRLFEETKRLAASLQKKVERATKDLRLKNQELKRIQQQQSKFFADISHDFKTPISVLRGNIDLVSSSISEEQYKDLDINIQRLNRLTTDLLELSKAESGQLQLKLLDTNISDIIIQAAHELSPLAEEKRISIINSVCKNIIMKADPARFYQIIVNLLSNGIKYNRHGGKVIIEYAQNDEHLELRFRDFGVGISPEDMPFVFDRFYRNKETKKQGTGLGLAIVKLMTEMHGGRVEVASEVGRYTEFTLRFPTNTASQLPLPSLPHSNPPTPLPHRALGALR